ncbi:MAG TPA: hypothetical protein VFP84_19940 [Kofleriaceae bacterium]|nr:hypothetical protein [Kofleriaceae bacterium]
MADKKDGREYNAERKANLVRLTDALRGSDELLTEFVGKPDQTASKYNLTLTQDEVSTLAALASGELSDEVLAAVSGGSNNNCICGNQQ